MSKNEKEKPEQTNIKFPIEPLLQMITKEASQAISLYLYLKKKELEGKKICIMDGDEVIDNILLTK